jgi:hypothetical protein
MLPVALRAAVTAGLLALMVAGPSTPGFAMPPQMDCPTPTVVTDVIEVLKAGEAQGDCWIWEYKVTYNTDPGLSHWILGICEDVYDSVKSVSIDGVQFDDPDMNGVFTRMGRDESIEFSDPDPTTCVTGMKFDDLDFEDLDGSEDGVVFSFLVNQNWAPGSLDATFKAGSDVVQVQHNVTGPSCELNTTVVPEPGTLALLATGCSPMLLRLRRRFRR